MKDIVGFTRMMAHSEAIRLPTFRSCREIMDNLFQEHGGRIFITGGDPALAGFQSVQQVKG
jgi:adenylate cyclase